jgi:hypothetical protein
MLADWGATSSVRNPVSSETRSPAHTARCSMARSRTPLSRRWIRSIKQSLHFFLDQIRHQTGVSFLEGDRQNTAHLLECSWLTVL